MARHFEAILMAAFAPSDARVCRTRPAWHLAIKDAGSNDTTLRRHAKIRQLRICIIWKLRNSAKAIFTSMKSDCISAFSGRAIASAAFVCSMLVANLHAEPYSTLYSFSDADGNGPYGSLTHHDSKLYGTTIQGGANGAGTIFSYDLATGTESVAHSFNGSGLLLKI